MIHHPIPGGEVQLLAVCGSDLDIVNAARVSFDKASDAWGEAENGILGYLIRNEHGSPLEHTYLRFRVKAPIFVFREWHRHRIASINEVSGRYTTLKPEFYLPETFRKRVGKPGNYVYVEMPEDNVTAEMRAQMKRTNEEAYQIYEGLLARDVAPEIARTVLPVSTFSEMWWSVNVRGLLNFLHLRTHATAQQEIREYAIDIEILFKEHFPYTWSHWHESGRTAP